MKAMLEPKIVAARIQRPADLLQGVTASFARMSASSQGGLAMFAIRGESEFVSMLNCCRHVYLCLVSRQYTTTA
jgi:hypothetical protein